MGAVSWSNLLGNNAGGGFEVHLALVGRWSLPAFMGAAKGEGCPCQGWVEGYPCQGGVCGVYPWCKGFHPSFSPSPVCPPTMSRLKVWLPSQSFIQNSPTPVQVQNHLTTYNGPFGLLWLESLEPCCIFFGSMLLFPSRLCYAPDDLRLGQTISTKAQGFQHKCKVFNISARFST